MLARISDCESASWNSRRKSNGTSVRALPQTAHRRTKYSVWPTHAVRCVQCGTRYFYSCALLEQVDCSPWRQALKCSRFEVALPVECKNSRSQERSVSKSNLQLFFARVCEVERSAKCRGLGGEVARNGKALGRTSEKLSGRPHFSKKPLLLASAQRQPRRRPTADDDKLPTMCTCPMRPLVRPRCLSANMDRSARLGREEQLPVHSASPQHQR